MKVSKYNKFTISILAIVVIVAIVMVNGNSDTALVSDTASLDAPNIVRLKVAASIYPIWSMVNFLGGEIVEAELVLPQGEHLQDLEEYFDSTNLDEAEAIFVVGHGLDTGFVLGDVEDKFVVLDKDINLLLEQGSTASPYYWLSVKQAGTIAKTIVNTLVALDPANEDYYRDRLNAFEITRLSVDANIALLMEQLPTKTIIVYGYDWGYFAQDYELSIVHYQPIVERSLTALQHEDFSAALEDSGLDVIFSDTLLSPLPLLPLLSQQRRTVMNLSILGGVNGLGDYNSTMADNARTIFEAYVPIELP